MNEKKLKVFVEKFQCPGCVNGGDTQCGRYEPRDFDAGGTCAAHIPGTSHALPGSTVTYALGMPKGFNRLGPRAPRTSYEGSHMPIVFWAKGTHSGFDRFNMAVWAMEGRDSHKGFLFVRTVEPRLGRVRVDVIEGGDLGDARGALNVADFYDEID